jgi:hypothetical protein
MNLVGILLLRLEFLQPDFFPIGQIITLVNINQTHPTQLQLQFQDMQTIIYNHYHQIIFKKETLNVTIFPISLPLLGQTNLQSRSVNPYQNMKINH